MHKNRSKKHPHLKQFYQKLYFCLCLLCKLFPNVFEFLDKFLANESFLLRNNLGFYAYQQTSSIISLLVN